MKEEEYGTLELDKKTIKMLEREGAKQGIYPDYSDIIEAIKPKDKENGINTRS